MLDTLTPYVVRILLDVRPQIVCLHGTPESHRIAAQQVWAQLQSLIQAAKIDWKPRLWIGVACDTHIGLVARGYRLPTTASVSLSDAADVAVKLGAELVQWNAEGACKINPKLASDVARLLIQGVRSRHPELVQAHTAYGAPMLHPEEDDEGHLLEHGYPWTVWYGNDGVDVAMPQDYAAPAFLETGEQPMASRGALRARLLRDFASWERGVQRKWIRQDLVRWPYVQLHHVPFSQTATYATDPQKVFKPGPESSLGHAWIGWALEKNRCDKDGERALRISAELYQRKLSVADFQRSAGIKVDGIAGEETEKFLFP